MNAKRWALPAVALSAVAGCFIACATGDGDADPGDAPPAVDLDGGGTDGRLNGGDGSSVVADGAKADARPTGVTGKIVINELQANGTSNAEFVELYNPGSSAVSLAGWKLDYRSDKNAAGTALVDPFASDATIAPGGFYLVANLAFDGPRDAPISAGGMAKGGGQVGLIDANGDLVDAVGYGTASGTYTESSPAPDPGTGSIGRTSDGVDTDDNGADFDETTSPSPGESN